MITGIQHAQLHVHCTNTPTLNTPFPRSLEMLDKTDIPLIPDGYPLVVAMNALLDAVRSVSLVVNDKKKAASTELKEVMLKSSWSGVMAALSLLLDTWWVEFDTLWVGLQLDIMVDVGSL